MSRRGPILMNHCYSSSHHHHQQQQQQHQQHHDEQTLQMNHPSSFAYHDSSLAQEKTMVSCGACTYENTKGSRECAMCGTPLPSTNGQRRRQQPRAASWNHHRGGEYEIAAEDISRLSLGSTTRKLLSDDSFYEMLAASVPSIDNSVDEIMNLSQRSGVNDDPLLGASVMEETSGLPPNSPPGAGSPTLTPSHSSGNVTAKRRPSHDEIVAIVLAKEELASKTEQARRDAELAAAIQQEEEDVRRRESVSSDAELAAAIQSDEESQRSLEESTGMLESQTGRAFSLVQKLVSLHRDLKSRIQGVAHLNLRTVAVDDIVFLAEIFIHCQEAFRAQGKPCEVTVAYHYTRSSSMDTIRKDGLMSRPERAAMNIRSGDGGSAFGDGIYTATNPDAFRSYGDVGLLVAILKGNQKEVEGPEPVEPSIDTVVGNKMANGLSPRDPYHNEIVLRQSMQCLPLLSFTRSSSIDNAGTDQLWECHKALQKLLDIFFNNGRMVRVEEIKCAVAQEQDKPLLPSDLPREFCHTVNVRSASLYAPRPQQHSLARSSSDTQPSHLSISAHPTQRSRELLYLDAPAVAATFMSKAVPDAIQSLASCQIQNGDCIICMSPLCDAGPGMVPIRLRKCSHDFHRQCIIKALENDQRCPICRKYATQPQGTSPSGTMRIDGITAACAGYETSSIMITYTLDGGKQAHYHPNPGVKFKGTQRIAYLPENDQGRRLLKRLKCAWQRGLTFAIGKSQSTGQSNSIVWSSIPHKTSLAGGASCHGYPDFSFFSYCHEELNALGVPSVEDCPF